MLLLLLRLIAILAIVAIAAGTATYLLTGNRKYLQFSIKLLKLALALALLFFGLMVLERLIVIV